MSNTTPLRKTDECFNCGQRLSTKQKYCPNCDAFNEDYKKRNWTSGEIAGYEPENTAENEKENDNKAR